MATEKLQRQRNERLNLVKERIGSKVQDIAVELGISEHYLRNWLDSVDKGRFVVDLFGILHYSHPERSFNPPPKNSPRVAHIGTDYLEKYPGEARHPLPPKAVNTILNLEHVPQGLTHQQYFFKKRR